jgi:hypothetical protein
MESERRVTGKITVQTLFANPRNAEALWEDHLSERVFVGTQVVGCRSSSAAGGDLEVTLTINCDDVSDGLRHVEAEVVPVITSASWENLHLEPQDLDDPGDAADVAGSALVSAVVINEDSFELTES